MRAPWLRLGLDSQLGATQDQRGVLTSETGASGVADVLAYVGKDASDAYVRHTLLPLLAADINAAALTDGLLNVISGVVGSQAKVLAAKVDAAALTDGLLNVASGVVGSQAKVLAAKVDASALANGLATVVSGALGVTNNPEVNSLIVDGGFRMGGVNGTPTITTGTTDGPGAGASATITGTAGGDQHGEFTLNASGTTSQGQIAKVVFTTALANASYNVDFFCRNGNAADLRFYLNTRNTTNFTIGARVAPTSGQNYAISYLVVGR